MSTDRNREMIIHGLTMDPNNNNPVLLLREKDGDRALPIWIGLFEANSIALHMSEAGTPRPLTHDMMYDTLTRAGISIDRVTVTELKDNTFYAMIDMSRGDEKLQIDSRPSDAVALAVRASCDIFVSEDVLAESAVDLASLDIKDSDEAQDAWSDLLDELDPEDYSKYKM
jgi:bifunctional DNase/RNase